jgi:hypothetical protein
MNCFLKIIHACQLIFLLSIFGDQKYDFIRKKASEVCCWCFVRSVVHHVLGQNLTLSNVFSIFRIQLLLRDDLLFDAIFANDPFE